MRILIADDNDLVRAGIAELLSDNGWDVCGEASNGAEAIQRVRELRPDGILLDISMPGSNGLEVAAILRQAQPTLKIVIISQNDLAHLLPRAAKELADGFVDKACLGTDLLPLLSKLLGRV
jgi:DNA-binding NarL/FixJ family response regulator